MTQGKMVGWHHWHNGHEFEQTLGDGEEQGSLLCCSLWGSKDSDITEWLYSNKMDVQFYQSHLLERRSFLHWVAFVSLPKISLACLYLFLGSLFCFIDLYISVNIYILIYICVYIYICQYHTVINNIAKE